jgi:hypothetical protein
VTFWARTGPGGCSDSRPSPWLSFLVIVKAGPGQVWVVGILSFGPGIGISFSFGPDRFRFLGWAGISVWAKNSVK